MFNNGYVHIVPNEKGWRSTPSYVAFTDKQQVIGEDAMDYAWLNPTTTVYGIKRVIGNMIDDEMQQHELDVFPYQIVNQDSRPFYPGGNRRGDGARRDLCHAAGQDEECRRGASHETSSMPYSLCLHTSTSNNVEPEQDSTWCASSMSSHSVRNRQKRK